MRYLLMLLLSWPLLADAIEFNETTRSLPLGRAMQVFEDASGQARIEDVSSPALADRFKPHDSATLNAGYSRSVFWLKVDLLYRPTQANAPRNWLLELAYPPLDHLDLYLADAMGRLQLAGRTGDALPFGTRQIRQNNYLFDLDLAAGQPRTLYLRLQSEGSIQAPLTLWSSTAYLEAQPLRLYVLGVIYGVLLGMLVYNLFIYLAVRDTSYLYYILYIAAFGLYQLSVNGAAVEYFWPDNPWWANAATPFFIGLAALFGSQFARSFLQTARLSRWLDGGLVALIAGSAVVVGLSLMTSYALALRLATALALIFTVAIFAAGVFAWWRGLRVARYFIIAWSAFLLGGVVNTLMVLGYLPNVFLTMYASQIGSAIEVGLLSLALADRINAMRDLQARTLQESGQKLAAMNQQLARTNQLKDEFLATVTHELRTPMNGVIGSLELIKTLDMGPELEQYTQTAQGSAREMMHMVNGILTLTELQAGRLVARPRPFSLNDLMQGLSEQFGPAARSKGLAFSYEVKRTLSDHWVGDADKIRQCLECLLDNAIKFTREGVVLVRVTGKPGESGRWALAFNVIDTGIGFVHQEQAELYQHFFQVDGSMTREYGGLGIGLAICRRLVELLGGRLTHHSLPGHGSQFQLLLELEPAPPLQVHSPTLMRAPGECVVLLVEDPVSPAVVRAMLLKLGYRVLGVDTGQAAIEALRRERVDAVVLACPLAQVSGTSMGSQLLTLAACAQLPVLALFDAEAEAREALEQVDGITDYLLKPLRFEDLQHTLCQRLLIEEDGKNAEF